MIIFLEIAFFLGVMVYLYQVAFKQANNPLNISKPLAIGLMIVCFLVLPPQIKALLVAGGIVFFVGKKILDKKAVQ